MDINADGNIDMDASAIYFELNVVSINTNDFSHVSNKARSKFSERHS